MLSVVQLQFMLCWGNGLLRRRRAYIESICYCNFYMSMSEVIIWHHVVIVKFLNEGSGGYGYLLEPLWWIGMITSKSWYLLFWKNITSATTVELDFDPLSDRWGVCQFCCLYVCSCCPCHTTGSIKYNCQVNVCLTVRIQFLTLQERRKWSCLFSIT